MSDSSAFHVDWEEAQGEEDEKDEEELSEERRG